MLLFNFGILRLRMSMGFQKAHDLLGRYPHFKSLFNFVLCKLPVEHIWKFKLWLDKQLQDLLVKFVFSISKHSEICFDYDELITHVLGIVVYKILVILLDVINLIF